jgi:hypothetical protein
MKTCKVVAIFSGVVLGCFFVLGFDGFVGWFII